MIPNVSTNSTFNPNNAVTITIKYGSISQKDDNVETTAASSTFPKNPYNTSARIAAGAAIHKFTLNLSFILHPWLRVAAIVVSEINGEQIDYKKKDYLSIAKKYFSYGLYHEYKNIDEAKKYALEDIRIIYGLMKSGFNLSDQKKEDYFKGYIFRYFYQKYPDYMNDKKFIKTHLKFKNCNTEKIEKIEKEKDNREGIYCRAVLGLAQKYEYKNLYEGTVEVVGESQKTENGNMVVERFPSPILWTLAGKYLLALPAEEALSLILNQKFCFQISDNNKATIKTPEEFNFKDFLYEFQKDFNDKELHKGGEKGLKDAENVMLMRAGSLELKNF